MWFFWLLGGSVVLDMFLHRRLIVFSFWVMCHRYHLSLYCWMDDCGDCSKYVARIRKMLAQERLPQARLRN